MKITPLLLLFGLAVNAAEVILENNHAAFVFESEHCYALKRIVNKQTKRTVEFAEPALKTGSPWQLNLLDEGRELPPLYGDGNVAVSHGRSAAGKTLTMRWEVKPATVTAVITLPDDSGIADWHLKAECTGKPAMWVKSAIFPRLDGVKTLGDDALIYGEYSGRLVRNPGKRLREVTIGHPGRWSMQFAAFYGSDQLNANELVNLGGSFKVNGFHRGPAPDETGLFLAADDGDDYQKTLKLNGRSKYADFVMAPVHYPVLPHWPMDSKPVGEKFVYDMPYQMKLGIFSGGAGAAADIYREMVKNRKWLENGIVRGGRHHISQRVLDGAFWAKFYHGANKVVPEILQMQEYLQVPVNTHWCRYGVGRFDDNNLDYFPTMAEYRSGVKTLRRAGVGVAPYVCCAIWDPDTESYRRNGMERAVARNEFGNPYIWPLAGNQPSFWMNPASPLWRAKYLETTMKMMGQFATDGQYLDVMACAGRLCYNTELHEPHGGNYWAGGNHKLLAELRRNAREITAEPFFTTEGFSENYINQIDAFLTLDITRYGWKNRAGIDVFPLFSLVYHDYAVAYGSDSGQRLTPEMLRWEMGLSFVWGIQLCWSDYVIAAPGNTVHDVYTRELAQAWYRSGYKFLTGGRGIETAQVPDAALAGNAAVAVISEPCKIALSGMISFPWEGPSVPGSTWRAHDGTIGITAANISGKPQNIKIKIDREKLNAQGNVIWRTWPLPAQRVGVLSGQNEWDFSLPADSALILEIRGEAEPEIRPLLEFNHRNVIADAKGIFPVTPRNGDEIYGADDVWALNNADGVTLVSERTSKPLRVSRMIDWRRHEGLGGPRDPDGRTFYVLQPSGWRLSGGTALVLYGNSVMAAEITAENNAVLTVPDDIAAVAVPADGIPFVIKGTVKLANGKYRVCGFKNQAIDSGNIFQSLGNISKTAAEAGRRILSGSDILPELVRNEGETLLAAGNAAAFAAVGKRIWLNAAHDWLLPGIPMQLRYEGITGGTLELLNSEQRGHVTIENHTVMVNHIAAAVNLLRFLYTAKISERNVTFAATALNYLEVAEPVLAEIDPVDAIIAKGSGPGTITNHITITNTAPFELPLTLSADLPPGWTFPADANQLQFTLKPQSRRKIPVTFISDGTAAAEHKFRVYVAYSPLASAAVSEDFTVMERNTRLQHAAKSPGIMEWSPVIRHHCMIAIPAADGKINIGLRPVTVGKRATSNVDWALLDASMKLLKSGSVAFKGAEQSLELDAGGTGTYFIRIAGHFFQVKTNGGLSCWEHDAFITCGRAKSKLWFKVNSGAEYFEFSATDGGLMEPARIIFRAPDGKAVYNRFGNYVSDQWIQIPVKPEHAGKIWRLEIEPTEDLEIRMRNGVSPWLSASETSVITE